MPMSLPHNLWISPELRQAITFMQACFGTNIWEDKFSSVNAVMRSKLQALAGAMNKVIGTYGQKDDFLLLREACLPTGWFVTFLERWKLSVDQQQPLVTFIQGVIDKVGNVYIMLNDAQSQHIEWTQLACMSSLLLQLKTMSQ
jgi:hypothetical protein